MTLKGLNKRAVEHLRPLLYVNEPLLTEHYTHLCSFSTQQSYIVLLCFAALMHKCSCALLHSKMSTLHAILDRLPQPMDNTPNTEQMFADENHDFIKLFNGNANYNDDTEIHNVKLNKTKSIIVGFIYRPNSQPRADMDIFTTELADITAKINNENKESYVMGDFNIDLLKFQSHEKTKYFIESMLTTGYLPVITKPTRVTDHSATLIDHIYSNSKSLNYKSRIVGLITDVADHFGTFYVSRKKSTYHSIEL